MTTSKKPACRFELGAIVATPGAIEATTHEYRLACLARHLNNDWGVVDPEDWQTNDEAARQGLRVLSAYPLDPALPCQGYGDNTLWIITEADRSTTTFLLPSEY